MAVSYEAVDIGEGTGGLSEVVCLTAAVEVVWFYFVFFVLFCLYFVPVIGVLFLTIS